MIRQAVTRDADSIMDMLPDIKKEMLADGNTQWDENYPLRSDIENDILNKNLYVCEIGGVISGFACINTIQPSQYVKVKWSSAVPCMVMHRMAIKPTERHKGLARDFMLFAEKLAMDNGVFYLRTDTCADNAKMRKLFDNMGYSYRGDIDYDGRTEVYRCYDKMLGV